MLEFNVGSIQGHNSIAFGCSNEAKHRERFALRAKYMTLEPTVNKYVKYIRNIRTIQVPFSCVLLSTPSVWHTEARESDVNLTAATRIACADKRSLFL